MRKIKWGKRKTESEGEREREWEREGEIRWGKRIIE